MLIRSLPLPTPQLWFVSLPASYMQRGWEIFMVLPIFYVASLMPFYVFFQPASDVRVVWWGGGGRGVDEGRARAVRGH